MSSGVPLLIDELNLSQAWARLYEATERSPKKELTTLVSFRVLGGPEADEELELKSALDSCLVSQGMQEIETVAGTIFPQSLWKLAKGDRAKLFSDYIENLPWYVRMAPRKNSRGLYFARLIAWDLDPKTGKRVNLVAGHLEAESGNQLEFIIKHCRPQVRRSMFQASIFDPARDHTPSAQLGFPCLQHITLVPDFGAGTLTLNAFYATQQAFEKAYGNFLGIARLGMFMAQETGLTLGRINCLVGIKKMDRKPKAGPRLQELRSVVARVIQKADAAKQLELAV